ncbi:MAG: mechanosensitive ion channel family protein [Actinomycetota bacterium]
MFTHTPTTQELVQAALFVVVGLVLGLTARTAAGWLLARRSHAARRSPGWVVVGAVGRAFFAWLVTAGVYAAVLVLPASARVTAGVAKGLLAVVILAGTFAVARIVGGLTELHAARHRDVLGSSSIFTNIGRLLVFVLGGLVVLQTMGVSIAPLLTALGVGGLAVALALQDTLSNLFAGLHVLASKKVLPGDYVRLDSGEEGYVVDINWRNTALRHIRNNVILVPNARLASAVVTNFYKPYPEMSVLVEIGVGHGCDLAHVERVTMDVARETLAEVEGGVKDFEPLMRYKRFGESSVDFNVILRVSEPTAEYLVRHEFVKRIHERYGREGIEIPFPIRTILAGEGARYPLVFDRDTDGDEAGRGAERGAGARA